MKPAVYTIILGKFPIDKALRMVSDVGARYVELMGEGWAGSHIPPTMSLERAAELRRLMDYLGLEAIAISSYVGRPGFSMLGDAEAVKEYEDYLRYLRLLDVLGAKAIRVLPGGPSPREAEERHWEQSVRWVRMCADANPKVRVLLEMHHNTLIEDTQSALRYLSLVDRENVGLIYDPSNLFIAKLRRPEIDYGAPMIRALRDKIFHVHAKNVRRTGGGRGFELTYLDEGEVDFRRLLEELGEQGYDGHVSIEYHVLEREKQPAILRRDYRVLLEMLRSIQGMPL